MEGGGGGGGGLKRGGGGGGGGLTHLTMGRRGATLGEHLERRLREWGKSDGRSESDGWSKCDGNSSIPNVCNISQHITHHYSSQPSSSSLRSPCSSCSYKLPTSGAFQSTLNRSRVVPGSSQPAPSSSSGYKYPHFNYASTATPTDGYDALRLLVGILSKSWGHLSHYRCKQALELTATLPDAHRLSPEVRRIRGMCYFETARYERAREEVRRVEGA